MDTVTVVTDETCEAGFTDLPQLTESEANIWLVRLVPEAVTAPQIPESLSHYARESWSYFTFRVGWVFKYSPCKKVDSLDVVIVHVLKLLKVFQRDDIRGGQEVQGRQPGAHPELVVARQAVVPAPLDVYGEEVAP